MDCPSCGADNPATGKFCGQCGSALPRRCATCGHPNPTANRFCGECGAALQPTGTPSMAPASEDRSASTLQDRTPRHLAEKILANRAALEGERKQVTVLFADIVGSTALIRDRDPEEAQALLDGAITRMMDAVHRYEGTVSRTTGDGLMAIFGAPVAHEDHALRACYAALALQEAMRAYAGATLRRHGAEIQARVGLNSGEVVVRVISDDLHMDYTALGQTVHLAARMEQLAAAGSIRITGATLALVEGYVQVRSLGPIPVKGIAAPVEVFEVLGAGAIRTRLQATAARGLTCFVGRHGELEALHRALEQARTGRGQVAALVGEPGVGKSRLVWEVTHSHRVEGWTLLEAGSASYGKATSWLPVIDLLRGYCRVEARDDARAVGEKVAGKVLMLDRALEPDLPALLTLLDAGAEDPDWEALDPPLRRRRTLDALKRLLLRESQVQPLLLVFEDLHWIDAETQAFLDGLVDGLPAARLFLLVNYRPEYAHTWGSKTYYTQLRLDPLDVEGADELLDALLGHDPSLPRLKRLLIERTGGNPFFLEEGVRALAEDGTLVGARGAYRFARPLEDLPVPATVQAVLAARIDRLQPEEKQLLQTAAVIGTTVPHAVLRTTAESSEEMLLRGLAALQAAEFLYEASLFPEPEYAFKHALTHEVAYGSLLHERRRALHARIVGATEALYPDRLAEHVEWLAHHALRGETWEAAAGYCHQAGQKAAARSANREAAAYFDQALAALGRLPEDRETVERAIDVRLELRTALLPLGESERVARVVDEAVALAEGLGDRRRLGLALASRMQTLSFLADYEATVEAGERALLIARELDDLGIAVRARHVLTQVYVARGEYRRALDHAARNADLVAGDLVRERFGGVSYPAIMALVFSALCHAELGDFERGAQCGREAIRLADDVDHPYSRIGTRTILGQVYVRQGRAHEASALLETARDLVETWELAELRTQVYTMLGAAYLLDGRLDDSLAQLAEAVAQAGAQERRYGTAIRLTFLGEAYLRAARVDDAVAAAGEAREFAAAHSERGNLARALWLLGEIAATRAPRQADDAEQSYREALALAEELGMRPLQAHCHLGLGTLYRRIGRTEEALVELGRAVAMLRDMEMAHWLPEAEAELASVTTSTGTPSA